MNPKLLIGIGIVVMVAGCVEVEENCILAGECPVAREVKYQVPSEIMSKPILNESHKIEACDSVVGYCNYKKNDDGWDCNFAMVSGSYFINYSFYFPNDTSLYGMVCEEGLGG